MRCNICDAELSEKDIIWSNDHQEWEPCPTCLHEIAEVFSDLSDEEIEKEIFEEFPWLNDDLENNA